MADDKPQPKKKPPAILTTTAIRDLLSKYLTPPLKPDGEIDETHPNSVVTGVIVSISERMDRLTVALGKIAEDIYQTDDAATEETPQGAPRPSPGPQAQAPAPASADEEDDLNNEELYPKPTNTSRVDGVSYNGPPKAPDTVTPNTAPPKTP